MLAGLERRDEARRATGVTGRIRPSLRATCLVAVALAAVLTARADPLPLPALEPLPAPQPQLEAALLAATNRARAHAGVGPLAAAEGLARAARQHAAEMARLNYFSHGSPVSAHDTLLKRLALAGSPLAEVAENIVMFPAQASPDASADKAVTEWLHSPPHRENLLNGAYDLVGFGTATDAQGELFVVQDFAAQPAPLLAYSLTSATRTVTEIHLQVVARTATEALFSATGAARQQRSLPAGRSTVVLTTDARGTASLVAAVPLQGTTFVADDGGVVDLATGTYRRDPGEPRRLLSIQSVSLQHHHDRGALLQLLYAPPKRGTLALFLQGSYQPAARLGPGDFQLYLPDTLGTSTIAVGYGTSGSAVTLIHRFHLDPGAAAPRLLAGPAG